jgi:hypothetical protein
MSNAKVSIENGSAISIEIVAFFPWNQNITNLSKNGAGVVRKNLRAMGEPAESKSMALQACASRSLIAKNIDRYMLQR